MQDSHRGKFMKKQNQNGRSMIEMLGVLAIAGVLTVGGVSLVHNANVTRQETQLAADVAQLGAVVKKLSCQYETTYGTYTNFLNKSEAIPMHMKYNSTGDYIEAAQDASITVTGDASYYVITVSGLEAGSCLKLATTNWGNKHSNGCLGVTIGGEDASSCMQSASSACSASSAKSSDTTNYPMKNTTASSLCGNNSTVKIWFKSCR